MKLETYHLCLIAKLGMSGANSCHATIFLHGLTCFTSGYNYKTLQFATHSVYKFHVFCRINTDNFRKYLSWIDTCDGYGLCFL